VKSKTPELVASSGSTSFSRFDIKRLGGFKTQDGRLVQMSGDVEPDGDADDSRVSKPEPGSLGLLFTGLLYIGALAGALAYRRNPSVVSAQFPRQHPEFELAHASGLGEFFLLEVFK
jgi:hypothetical protein